MGREETLLENDYRYNRDFRHYVDRHCQMYGCTVEEALQNHNVREARKHYTEV